jgi:hypothetical protein
MDPFTTSDLRYSILAPPARFPGSRGVEANHERAWRLADGMVQDAVWIRSPIRRIECGGREICLAVPGDVFFLALQAQARLARPMPGGDSLDEISSNLGRTNSGDVEKQG